MTRNHRFRSWWRRRFRTIHTHCRRCGNPITVIRGTAAHYWGLCNSCTRHLTS